MLMLLVSINLAGCGLNRSVETPQPSQIRLDPPDSRLTRRCAYASTGWAEAVIQEAQEALIRQDRRALKTCRDRHGALVAWSLGVVEAVNAVGEEEVQ